MDRQRESGTHRNCSMETEHKQWTDREKTPREIDSDTRQDTGRGRDRHTPRGSKKDKRQ